MNAHIHADTGCYRQEVASDLGLEQAAVGGVRCASSLPLLPLYLDFCSETERGHVSSSFRTWTDTMHGFP